MQSGFGKTRDNPAAVTDIVLDKNAFNKIVLKFLKENSHD